MAIHRDDLDPELLEAMTQQFPGFKVICAGDMPEGSLPPHMAEALTALQDQANDSLLHGTCIDCGKTMPGYPAIDADPDDDWKPAEGWTSFTDLSAQSFSGWQCPVCAAAEEPDISIP